MTPRFQQGDRVQSAPTSSDVRSMRGVYHGVVHTVRRGVVGAPDGACYVILGQWRWLDPEPPSWATADSATITSRQLWADSLILTPENPMPEPAPAEPLPTDAEADAAERRAVEAGEVHPCTSSAEWSVPAWLVGPRESRIQPGCVWILHNEAQAPDTRYVVARVWHAEDEDGDPTYPDLPEAYFRAVDGEGTDAHITDGTFLTFGEALAFARVVAAFGVAQRAIEHGDDEALDESNAAFALATAYGWHYEDDEDFMDWALKGTQPEILAHAITCIARTRGCAS